MRIFKIEQNSEEWLEYRKGKSGGSGFSKVFPKKDPKKEEILAFYTDEGIPYEKTWTIKDLLERLAPQDLAKLKLRIAPKEAYYKMLAERVARPITPNDYADRIPNISQLPRAEFMMVRGHLLEDEARTLASERIGIKFVGEDEIWVSDYNDSIFVSPDGWKKDDDGKVRKALEIKCLGSDKVVEAYITQKYPEEYYPQVCKYFIVNDDLEVLYFVIYTDLIPGLELQVWEIKRSDVESDIEVMRFYEDGLMRQMDEDEKRIREAGF